jgi:hypothetical protein
MKWVENPAILSAAMGRLQTEIGRIEDIRGRNRQIAIIAVGAAIGFMVKEQELANIVIVGIAALVVSCLFWFHDHRLHSYSYAWNNVDVRLRQYLQGKIGAEELKLLEYNKSDEKKAKFWSTSSGPIYLTLSLSPILLFLFRLFW